MDDSKQQGLPQTIQNLIKAHQTDKLRVDHAGSMPQITVSKAVSAMAKLYEMIRNSIEYEEEHLLRKRAIKRILFRMGVLKKDITQEIAADIVKEIIWAKYMIDFPKPELVVESVKTTISKYKKLVDTYIKINGEKPDKDTAEFLYSLLAVELERVLVPHSAMDALVNAQYRHLLPMNLLAHTGIGEKQIPVQTYIAVHRALLKSDRDIISYYLFYNAFNQWGNPAEEYYQFIAKNLGRVVQDIDQHLGVILPNRLTQEIVRQAIPFKILNNIIKRDLVDAEKTILDPKDLEKQVEEVSKVEYKKVKGKLRNTIIRSIIYLFITKVIFAIIVEVPYELFVLGHINYITLVINIVFPPVLMFLIATTFGIPEVKNTEKLKEMINSILNPKSVDLSEINKSYMGRTGGLMSGMFKALNIFSFFAVFGALIVGLFLIKFNIVGIAIFLMFLTLISFVALRLRKTAKEIVVINQARSLFSPLIDIMSVPILKIGRYLSDTVSQINIFTIIFDVLLEAPFKTIIKVMEDWTSYLRDQRDEIV